LDLRRQTNNNKTRKKSGRRNVIKVKSNSSVNLFQDEAPRKNHHEITIDHHEITIDHYEITMQLGPVFLQKKTINSLFIDV